MVVFAEVNSLVDVEMNIVRQGGKGFHGIVPVFLVGHTVEPLNVSAPPR